MFLRLVNRVALLAEAWCLGWAYLFCGVVTILTLGFYYIAPPEGVALSYWTAKLFRR